MTSRVPTSLATTRRANASASLPALTTTGVAAVMTLRLPTPAPLSPTGVAAVMTLRLPTPGLLSPRSKQQASQR